MAEIVNAGRDFFALKQGAGLPANIDRFVLAMVPGLNPVAPINLAEGLPAEQYIVGEFAVSGAGYVSPDRVVYSLILDTMAGDFDFNWIGLLADNDTLIAVSHIPTISKYKTAGGVLGNSITRNFLIEYQNAQSITGITVEAGTWQIDFVARFNQQTDVMMKIAADVLGSQFFVEEGFAVIREGGQWKVTDGYGYVGGIRIENAVKTVFAAAALPVDVWLDVYLDKNISTVDPVWEVVTVPSGTPVNNYTALNGVEHYVAKIAALVSTTDYTDLRRSIAGTDGIVASLYQSWQEFLQDAGDKTDYLHLQANTPLERNSRNFTDNNLVHTLPPYAECEIGDVIRLRKRNGEFGTQIVVHDDETETVLVNETVGTGINYDLDGEIAIGFTGTRWECS